MIAASVTIVLTVALLGRHRHRARAGRVLDEHQLCRLPRGSRAIGVRRDSPGSRQAVATLSAANTPIVAWARCGMNERVEIDAALARRRHQDHLRHRLLLHVAEVHHRPDLEPDRLDARLELRVGVELRRASRSRCGRHRRAHDDHRHAVVDAGDARRRRSTSTARPVGRSAPHVEPAVSEKLSGIGAAVPGTPSMRASPW